MKYTNKIKNSLQIIILLFVSAAAFLSVNMSLNPYESNEKNADINNFENKFFRMDFERDHKNLQGFKEHFFTTFPHNDPTLGNVVYDKAQWENDSIIVEKKNEGIYSYVKKRTDERGFDSFRLTTKAFFNLSDSTDAILFVFKGSFPSDKGLWPAWWLNGSMQDEWIMRDSGTAATDEYLDRFSGQGFFYNTPSTVNCTDWPGGGEIDIIENINGEDLIHNTLHTCPQMCDSKWNDEDIIINCANAIESDPNSGCSGNTYTLEKKQGTFACLWQMNQIRFYYWMPETDVRAEGGPLSDKPDPDSWNKLYLKNKVALIETETECDDETHQEWQCNNCAQFDKCQFINMKMIFNTTVCGVWAGNKFDDTGDSFNNCKSYVLGEGKDKINNQFLKIEYVSVVRI